MTISNGRYGRTFTNRPKRRVHPLEGRVPMQGIRIVLSVAVKELGTQISVSSNDVNKAAAQIISRFRASAGASLDTDAMVPQLKLPLEIRHTDGKPTDENNAALRKVLDHLRTNAASMVSDSCPVGGVPGWSADDLVDYVGILCYGLRDNRLAFIDVGCVEDLPSQRLLARDYISKWRCLRMLSSSAVGKLPAEHEQQDMDNSDEEETTFPFGCVIESHRLFPQDPNLILNCELTCAVSLLRRRMDYPSSRFPAEPRELGELAPPAVVLTVVQDGKDLSNDAPILARVVRASLVRSLNTLQPKLLIEVGQTIDFSSVHRRSEWDSADKADWGDMIARLLSPVLDPQIPKGCPLCVDPLAGLKQELNGGHPVNTTRLTRDVPESWDAENYDEDNLRHGSLVKHENGKSMGFTENIAVDKEMAGSD